MLLSIKATRGLWGDLFMWYNGDDDDDLPGSFEHFRLNILITTE